MQKLYGSPKEVIGIHILPRLKKYPKPIPEGDREIISVFNTVYPENMEEDVRDLLEKANHIYVGKPYSTWLGPEPLNVKPRPKKYPLLCRLFGHKLLVGFGGLMGESICCRSHCSYVSPATTWDRNGLPDNPNPAPMPDVKPCKRESSNG